MNPAPTLLIALALLTLAGSAQDQTVSVPELETLKKEYASLVKSTDGPYLAAVAELDKKYIARLEQEQQTAQQAGKLEEALAIAGEKNAILPGSGVPLDDDDKTSAVLRKMHATYRAEIAKLEVVRARNYKPLRDDYAEELDALVLLLTKDGKLQEAMTVRKFRENLAIVSPVASLKLSAGKVVSVDLPGGVVMKFSYCPPGSFKMGSPPDLAGRRGDEDQVKVRLSKGFWMAQTECTQAQWVAVMGANPSEFKGDDLPVEMVNWHDAQKFITKLNKAKTLPAGLKAALPTEAQWEYACCAGTKTAYSFGDTLSAKQANMMPPGLGKTSVAASYAANAWGLYDMHGNVSEWCEDWYGDKLVGGTEPTGVTSGTFRVLRGGDWNGDANSCRVAIRRFSSPTDRFSSIGFRVTLNSVP